MSKADLAWWFNFAQKDWANVYTKTKLKMVSELEHQINPDAPWLGDGMSFKIFEKYQEGAARVVKEIEDLANGQKQQLTESTITYTIRPDTPIASCMYVKHDIETAADVACSVFRNLLEEERQRGFDFKRCKRCDKLFINVRNKKQKFCSKACAAKGEIKKE